MRRKMLKQAASVPGRRGTKAQAAKTVPGLKAWAVKAVPCLNGRAVSLLAAVLTGLSVLSLPLLFPLTSFGAVFSYEEYDWEAGADDVDDSDSFEGGDSDSGNGPGVVLDPDSGTQEGPSVDQVTLSERYHDDYKIYEESMANQFFFYASVANGGITHEAVTLDIPGNISWSMEKDGYPWEWTPGQPISGYGTYVVKLTAIEDEGLPLSEQKEYRSVFRFRIQEKPPEETDANPSVTFSGLGGQASISVSGLGSQTGLPHPAGEQTGQQPLEMDPLEASLPEVNPQEAGAGQDRTSETVEEGSGTEDGPAAQETASEVEEPSEPQEETEDIETPAPASGQERAMISQEYDSRSKRYSITFDNGLSFSSSVPDGYVGPGPVQLVLPEAKAQEASLYLEDQPLEHDATCYLEEPGIYRLKAGDSTLSFAICTATGSMDIYPAPRGTHFAEASLEGEPLSLDSEAYVLMKGDGQYHLVLEGEAGERFNVGIRKDTRPPEVSVAVRGGSAVIQYLSEDIKEVLLEKDGEPVEGFHANSITKPGRYRLTVTDEAGNETVTDFVLKYRVNAYGITAAVLVILVIAGGVAFVVHTKKTVKIR